MGNNPVNFTDPFGERPLTDGEIGLLTPIFNNTIDYAKIEVKNGAGWNPIAGIAHLKGHPAITLGNTIYFRSENYPATDDFSSAKIESKSLLVHETAHVWQKQTNPKYSEIKAGVEGLRGADAYNYSLDPDSPSTIDGPPKPLTLYGYEQQAQIVENGFLATKGLSSIFRPLSGSGREDYFNSHMSTMATSYLGPWAAASGTQSLTMFNASAPGGRIK